jgi:glycine oxidase
LLGQIGENRFIASGHYRNGILLAPATALVMAQTLAGERPAVDLSAFSPLRQEELKIAQV